VRYFSNHLKSSMACTVGLVFAGCCKCTSPDAACLNNLRQIDGAKAVWAIEEHKETNDVPTWDDLRRLFYALPKCPSGGTYSIGRVCDVPMCSLPSHTVLWNDALKRAALRNYLGTRKLH